MTQISVVLAGYALNLVDPCGHKLAGAGVVLGRQTSAPSSPLPSATVEVA